MGSSKTRVRRNGAEPATCRRWALRRQLPHSGRHSLHRVRQDPRAPQSPAAKVTHFHIESPGAKRWLRRGKRRSKPYPASLLRRLLGSTGGPQRLERRRDAEPHADPVDKRRGGWKRTTAACSAAQARISESVAFSRPIPDQCCASWPETRSRATQAGARLTSTTSFMKRQDRLRAPRHATRHT